MTRALLFLLLLACAVSCGPTGKSQGIFGGVTEYRIITVRGCEYVAATSGNEGLAHAGDCPNPIHRSPR